MLIGGDLIWKWRHESSTNAESDVNNEAKLFRINIANAKPAIKSETVKYNLY